MTERTSVIPFPRRNERNYLMSRRQRKATAADSIPEKPAATADPASVVIEMTGNKLPQLPELYGLMNEQCAILVDAMQALVDYAEDDARAAHKAKRNSEKIYSHALAELADCEDTAMMRKADRERLKATSETFGMLKHRELYHNLAKSAKRLVWAANRLREIVPHTV